MTTQNNVTKTHEATEALVLELATRLESAITPFVVGVAEECAEEFTQEVVDNTRVEVTNQVVQVVANGTIKYLKLGAATVDSDDKPSEETAEQEVGVLGTVWNVITYPFKWIWNKIKQGWNWVKEQCNKAHNWIKSLLGAVNAKLTNLKS